MTESDAMPVRGHKDVAGEIDADVFVSNCRVFDGGAVTIEKETRDRLGIERGDAVHVTAITRDGAELFVQAKTVVNDGQVRIPHRLREAYRISDGEYVHLVVSAASPDPPER